MKRRLGKSDIQVSAMGLGGWAIGGPFWRETDEGRRPMGWGKVDDKESIKAIHAAMDLGINFFDTANNYGAGHSEEVLGPALKDRRDKVVIATKFGSVFDEETKTHLDSEGEFAVITEEFLRDALEGSLRRLDIETIDLYQFHRAEYDLELAPDVMGILEKFVEEGKIRWYGWSTDRLDRAQIFGQGDHCASIQFSLNVFMDNPEMLALIEEFGLAGINKHPLASGSLTGKFHKDYTFPEDDLRHGIDWTSERGQTRLKLVDAIREILTSEGRTMAQGALAWIWGRSGRTIPIPGFKNVAQVEENAKAMEYGPLSEEQMKEIEEILEI